MREKPRKEGELALYLSLYHTDETFQGHKLSTPTMSSHETKLTDLVQEEQKLVDVAIRCMQERFSSVFQHPIVGSCEIFDPNNRPPDDASKDYGNNEMDVLVEKSKDPLSQSLSGNINVAEVKATAGDERQELLDLLKRRKARTYERVYEATVCAKEQFPVVTR